ncbi:MAG: hypothetical protein ACRDZ7_22965, partial [Acidimicrobiia bacterium]
GGSSDSGDTVGAAAQPGGSNGSTPLPPTITKAPEDPTFDTTAQFKFTGQSGVGFRCRLDGGAVSSCNSGTANYNKLEPGEHTFEVRAINASAALSAPATYTWTILLRSGFEITGSLDQVLYPGTSERVNLSLGNPYNFPLRVLGVEVTVEPETTNPGCIGDDNLSVVHGLTGEVVVPARSTMSLLELGVDPGLWPLVEMLNLDTNQDACKNATFKLSYEGTGTKA